MPDVLCPNCGFVLAELQHRLLKKPVPCPRCARPEVFGLGGVAASAPFKVFDAMDAQQRETTPALAAALARHVQSVQQASLRAADEVRREVAKFTDLNARRPSHLYLGWRHYNTLRQSCLDGEAMTLFDGIPVLEVRAESHIGVA